MAFLRSLDIVGSALTAERYRSDIILQNISQARTTRTAAGGPYRRQQVVFVEKPLANAASFSETFRHACKLRNYRTATSGGVRVETMVDSINEFKPVYDPQHPDADAEGYVWYPNVDTTEEMTDLMATTLAYDANLSALSIVRAMISRTMEFGK